MATFELHPVAVEPTARNLDLLRSLGSLALAASPMAGLGSVVAALTRPSSSAPVVGLLGFVFCLGWLCSLAGLYLTGAMGRGVFERRVLSIQTVLVAAAAAWSIGEPALSGAGDSGLPFVPGDLAWPLGHLGMIAVGAAVLRAGAWSGWARVAPLACGVAFAVAAGLTGFASHGLGAIGSALVTGAAFAALAWAVRSSGSRLAR